MRRFASAVAIAIALGAASAVAAVDAPPRPPSGPLLVALAQPPTRPPLAQQRIYFVMPDRYANGNPANDTGGVSGAKSTTGFDPTDTGYFHGGDFAGLTGDCSGPRGLARIKALGFTSVWVTPPFRQKAVQTGSAAYHGYWALGFDGVDPHLGTEADFAAFVNCAHRLGLKVILDVVVNHTADVIQLPSYEYGPPKPPFVPPAERNVKSPGWLNDPANYHNRGNIDFNSCASACLELGDFFGLDDIATEKQSVRDGLADVFAGWIRRYKVDGFRIDTARHVERGFFGDWVPKILTAAREAGVADFQLFGEAFLTNAIELSEYVRDRGLPNVLDFPMQDAIARFVGGSAGAAGIADRLRDDDYFALPSGVVHTPPTFIGNHDIGRAALMIRSAGAGAPGPLLDRVLLGYDLLYLLRGAPVVYYGDEFGLIGRGGDQQARHDLFPTQVQEWQTEERLVGGPIGTGSSFDREVNPIAGRLRTLAALREAHPALATGATFIRHVSRDAFAFSRIDAVERREYVVIVNARSTRTRLSIGTGGAESFDGVLGFEGSVLTIPSSGIFGITVQPFSTIVLRAAGTVQVGRPRRPGLTVRPDSLTDLVRLTAVAGSSPQIGEFRGPISVTFAVKRRSGRWQRLAADDSPPYRAFLDPTSFRLRERVHLVAIARSLDGRTAVSAVRSFVPRR